MPISGIPTTAGNDTVTVSPTGSYSIDGQAGVDTLVLNYGGLAGDITNDYAGGGWYSFSDAYRSSVTYINFERFVITGGSGNDYLSGAGLNDRLVGGAGFDTLAGGLGADTIIGGAGVDRWNGDYSSLAGPVRLTLATTGFANIAATGARISGIEAIDLTTGGGADRIDTSAYGNNDVIRTGGNNDLIASGRGRDIVDGGAGTDTLVMDWSGISNAAQGITGSYIGGGWNRYAAASGDQLDFINIERFNLTGGAGNDWLGGGGMNDQLTGNGGNDFLDGGAGVDAVDGGAGVDTWQVNTSARGSVTEVNLTDQTTNYGATLSGIEQIRYTSGGARDTVTALAGAFDDTFATGGGNDSVTTGRGRDRADGGDGRDLLVMDWSAITDASFAIANSYLGGGWFRYAAASGDQLDYVNFDQFNLTGGAGNDSLSGGADNDTLVGGGGDDVLSSGVGNAEIVGGTGNDLWSADLSNRGAVRFNAHQGQTTAQLTSLFGMSVLGIEQLALTTGTAADSISMQGFARDDHIVTNDGNDTVNGGRGIDTMDGGLGDDILVVNYATATSDVTNSYVGGGWFRYAMGDGSVTHVDWINFERFRVTGGSGNDHLDGGALNDTLRGNGGNDVLNGGSGTDVIVGGAGSDTWIGEFSALGQAITLNLTAAGNGTVAGPGTHLTGVESVHIVTSGLNDLIDLSLGSGNDDVRTLEGDDVIRLGRGLTEVADGGGGNDFLQFDASLAESGVRMRYDGGGWTGAHSTSGDYNVSFVNIETVEIIGSTHNDRLYGLDGNDTLDGNAGLDRLDGGHGNDQLTGGVGTDVFNFSDIWNAGVDVITDAAAGDILRMEGVGLVGAMGSGDGSTLMGGEMDLSVAGGVTTLHLGLDGTAGADFSVTLQGVYAVGDFSLSGSDVLLI